MDQLDDIFFADYIDRKKKAVSHIITEGILSGGIDWHNIAKPTGKSKRKDVIRDTQACDIDALNFTEF